MSRMLIRELSKHPVIAAVRTMEAISRAAASPVAAIFILGGSISNLKEMVSRAHDGNKYAVQAANIAGFGILWVLKYVFLDKIMFGPDHHTPYDEDIELEEAALGHQPPS